MTTAEALSSMPLDPLALPLRDSQLIEASAGTGKTFTIAMLYVRLVLGHGGEAASFPRGALTPPEILVVTFTEAATRELRDRIRARLAEAARCFREDPDSIDPSQASELLHTLRAQYPTDDWPSCARRLELAAEWMDEAAISTIHAWCNRMLREHAFDSQSLFTQALETDQSELLAETVRDYWRDFCHPLDARQMAQFAACWKTPAALEKAVRPLLKHVDQLPDPAAPATTIDTCLEEKRKQLTALKQPWHNWIDQLRALFDKARQAKQLDGRKLRADWYDKWFDNLQEWAGNPDQESIDIGKGWDRLTPEGIADAWKAPPPPEHPAFAEITKLKAALDNLPEPKTGLLCHAARWVAARFEREQKRRAQIGFDDLLHGLETALGGPGGERLIATIREQFPVALIDEFQDTDPIQYRIFERIYATEARQDTALILIGDPKQAIYAFRGADIYTYLKARAAVAGRLHTLDTNYRSTQAMVDATNHCFAQAEQCAEDSGAFRFRQHPGGDNPVPFHPVKARGRRDDFRVDGQTPPAMTLAVLAAEDKVPAGSYIAQMADLCATRIVDWLNRGQAGQAGFSGKERHFISLRPADIAILVNNAKEATAIRRALARRGVRSVYLSDKDTVYAAPQAVEVRRWLAACAEPDDDRLLRAALSTATLGLSFAALDELNVDEDAWEARVVQFKGYRDVWQKQGVLPMVRRILIDFACSDRLLDVDATLGGDSGERILTDILHLAELLQQASFALEGEHALIRFLAEQIADPAGDADERKLRLESDADLIQVVTIHKSKGLEYPLVFLPFICATRLTKGKDPILKWHDGQGGLRISLKADPEILRRTDDERLGEDLRKVYVALTRARYHTWLGLAPLKDNEPSAIGHLFRLAGVDAAQHADAVKAFAAGQPFLHVDAAPQANAARFAPTAPACTPGPACRPVRRASEDWWIGSYSALQVEGYGHAPVMPEAFADTDTPQAENLREGQREHAPTVLPANRAGEPMHRFFKGAEAGTFLHDLLEWVAQEGFTTALADPAALRDMVARRCQVRGWERWVDPLCAWLRRMLTTGLPIAAENASGHPLRLDTLTTAKAEMEFWFEACHVDLARLDAVVIEHTLNRRSRPPLLPEQFNGMLKGFMDLVFEHDGRYYVADYKSNWLGPGDEDYTPAAMEEAICTHRYDLQYAIYLFALHRLLKSRLPDYDYDRHVGGAVYLFVRGIDAASAGVHHERPPRMLMEQLDTLFAGRQGGAA